ncbi:MAG: hypothetical protein L6461_04795 [Anaerolineae bacterium]|nr:hypothetical protein [Anaerolineae bacterium]
MRTILSIILCIIFLTACAVPPPAAATEFLPVVELSATPNMTPQLTPTATLTPHPISTPASPIEETLQPSETPTIAPVFEQDGTITWYPNNVLVLWEGGAGDGVGFFITPPQLILLGDGTLIQRGNYSNQPFISHLDEKELCKFLNTIDVSGFFDDDFRYSFPFDGLSSSYISISAWKSNSNGTQILDYAISGAPYYDTLFCRDCPIPDKNTIIRPPLANIYFFLKSYTPAKRQVAAFERIIFSIEPVNTESSRDWPIKSITPVDLWSKCLEEACYDQGMLLEGDVAIEINDKVESGLIFSGEIYPDQPSFKIMYRPIWPGESSLRYYRPNWPTQVPQQTPVIPITCKKNDGYYQLLPLSLENDFWYYAPDGEWGAEVVSGTNKIRVVNHSGYERFYEYKPSLFGQESVQFYPRYWSKDNRFFYVNVLPGKYKPDNTFVNSIGLQKIDVRNEKVNYIFVGTNGQSFSYAFSHDGKKVAYIRQEDNPLKLVIVDAYTGVEQSVLLIGPDLLPYKSAGSIFWSQNDENIYFAAIRQNGQDSDIVTTNSSNLSNIKVIHTENTPLILSTATFWDTTISICSLNSFRCQARLNTETGMIDK